MFKNIVVVLACLVAAFAAATPSPTAPTNSWYAPLPSLSSSRRAAQ